MAIISIDFLSQMMSRTVSAKVILPFDGYTPANPYDYTDEVKPFKTLYYLHGYSSNAEMILSHINFAELSTAKGFAVVIPNGENSFYIDQPEERTFYGRFIAEELVAVTRKLFPLSTHREDTFIGGMSMGGYGALALGSRYMDTFSKIIAMSPAIYPYDLSDMGILPLPLLNRVFISKENYQHYYDPLTILSQAKDAGKELPGLYVCCGTEDDRTYVVDCKFANDLRKAGIPFEYCESEGAHDSSYWNKVLPESMDFMLRD